MSTTKKFTCDQCGETKEPAIDSISTGYGTDKDNKKICFTCCGINDLSKLENAKIGDRFTYYLINRDGKHFIENWPGTMSIRIHYVRKGKHNIAGSRYDFWFGYKGNNFHGIQYGNFTQIAHIKTVKG